jgi:3-phenylpropionate/cinnamic acid dioxygenase small subunit
VSHDELGRTLALYCQLCDDGRFDEWIELFTEDARFTVLGETHVGHDDIKAWISEMQAPQYRGKHILGQSVFDLEPSGDTASGTTDYTFVSGTPEGGYVVTSAGRYYDTFVRSGDGSWRFVTREIRFLGA